VLDHVGPWHVPSLFPVHGCETIETFDRCINVFLHTSLHGKESGKKESEIIPGSNFHWKTKRGECTSRQW
jgi:hypothetical protein